MTISMDKKYRTREGREVRLYATDGGGNFPVHGAYKNEVNTWVPEMWPRDGHRFVETGSDPRDLIEVKTKREGWVNIYRSLQRAGNAWAGDVVADENEAKRLAAEADEATHLATIRIEWEE